MRVVQVAQFGGPEVLVPAEAPDPVAGVGQVVVDVSVAGITFVETQIRAGNDKWHDAPKLPYIPGGVVTGRVSAVGFGVDPGWSGRRVLANTGQTGGFAERAVAAVHDLIPVPGGLALTAAAALHTDGSTALGLIDRAQIRPGEWVLIEAAAGGVGTLLVQLAHNAGARVIGAAAGRQKLDLIDGLGTDAVVDYSGPGWTEQVLDVTNGAGASLVFDGVGGSIGEAAFEIVADGGRFSIHGASSGRATAPDLDQARRRGVDVIGIDQLYGFGPHMRRWAEQIMTEAVAGRVRPIIGQTFPLEHAAHAHAAIETRSVLGKTVLLI